MRSSLPNHDPCPQAPAQEAGQGSTGPKPERGARRDTGKTVACLCLIAASLGTFALDRALREPDRAPEDPIKTGRKPALPPTTRAAWMPERSLLGESAPNFQLPDFDDGHEVSLAALRARKPVVLIFGSFSCDVFVNDAAAVERFYREHKDQAEFLFVYVDEAGHDIPDLGPILAAIPPGQDNQRQRVQKGRECLHQTIPTVLDTRDRAVLTAYNAYPRRLVVVDQDGRIALDLGRGLDDPGWDFGRLDAWLREKHPPQ